MPWKLQSDRPIWVQLAEVLTQRIASGQYPAGIRIPSVRDLAADAGVNPNTMQRALTALEERGLVSAQRNTGRFVTEDEVLIAETRKTLAQEELSAFCEKMRQLGFDANELAQLLQTKGESK
ncbi:MAG: GntR family transcriptional regulator [Faecousia sp.]|nr:GntR family transcriptional regulator [Bacillota bacterium]